MKNEMLLLQDKSDPVFVKEVYLIPDCQEVRIYLKGPKLTVQFCFWLRNDSPVPYQSFGGITGFDLGYHSPVPIYEGQIKMADKCPRSPGGGVCYYDGTSLGAEELAKEVMKNGDFSLAWRRMAEFYKSHAGNL